MTALFAKSAAINRLSFARFFLFGARDIWFVVAVPIFLYEIAGWSYVQVSTFLALWVIGYGFVQAIAPNLVRRTTEGLAGEVKAARFWILGLALLPAALVVALAQIVPWPLLVDHAATTTAPIPAAGLAVAIGLGLFGAVFAINSSLHSFLILAYAEAEAVAMDVGFYYMANAAGRLTGCLLSGLVYQWAGVVGALSAAAVFLVIGWVVSLTLPTRAAPVVAISS
jgi:hypothetical protein